jgi:hypothetical protein
VLLAVDRIGSAVLLTIANPETAFGWCEGAAIRSAIVSHFLVDGGFTGIVVARSRK